MIENHGNSLPALELQIYAKPAHCTSDGFIDVEEQTLPTLAARDVDASLMEVSFEDVGRRLTSFERCFFEPDGSFVWTGQSMEDLRWQLDGMLYDRADRVQRVELHGTCPRAIWLQLLAAIGAPGAQLIAFLCNQKCFVPIDALLPLWNHDA